MPNISRFDDVKFKNINKNILSQFFLHKISV